MPCWLSSRTMPVLATGVLLSAVIGATPVNAQCQTHELSQLHADDASISDKFGVSMSSSGDTVVIGAFGDENETGAAYVFVTDGESWTQEAKLVAPDGAFTDFFGWSVAITGDTIVVGSRYDDDAGGNSGSAYVFERSGTSWSYQAKLTAGDATDVDLFGESVAIDGDTIVVGAIGDDDLGEHSGSVYVFVGSGTSWSQQAKLVAVGGQAWDEFGFSVDIEGDTVVVGSIGDNDNGSNSGSAYVYTRTGTSWNAGVELHPDDGATSDNFGNCVALDGVTLVVGAPADDDMGSTSGSAYVFQGSGTLWTQVDKLVASDGSDNAQFGHCATLADDLIVIGAANETNQGYSAAGSAYVFTPGARGWTEAAKLLSSDPGLVDSLGCSVALGADTAIVGARNDDDHGNNSGAAYVYRGLSDCNGNATLDICDIADGTSADENGNGLPDECDCPGDLDGDGDIDLADLAQLLSNYGTTSGAEHEDGDVDFDGDVDLSDLAALLSVYGTTCE